MRLTLISVLAFTLCTTAQPTKSNITPKNWKAIDDARYSIQYPDTFDLDQSGQMGMLFIVLSKQTSEQDLFRENVNLIQQDLGGQGINLDEFVKISEEQIKTLITNGNIVSSQRVKSKSSEYHQVIFSGDQGQYHLK